jgi:hypothetical protein
LIFYGGDPRGTYFYANWLRRALSLVLKLSASDNDCPFKKDVSLDDDEYVDTLP